MPKTKKKSFLKLKNQKQNSKLYYLKYKNFHWKKILKKSKTFASSNKNIVFNTSDLLCKSGNLKARYFFSFFKFIIGLKKKINLNIFLVSYLAKKLINVLFKNGAKHYVWNIFFQALFFFGRKKNISPKIFLLYLLIKLETKMSFKDFFLKRTRITLVLPSASKKKSFTPGIFWFKNSLKERTERTLFLKLVAEFSELLYNKGGTIKNKKKYISDILAISMKNKRYEKFILKSVI